MNCPECGTDVVGEAVFCHRCGARLNEASFGGQGDAGGVQAAASISRSEADRTPAGAGKPNLAPRGDDDDSEAEIWSGGYSPKAMVPHALGLAAGSVVLLIVAAYLPWQGGMKWLVFLGGIALAWLFLGGLLVFRRLDVSYRLTNQRFVHESGILRRTTDRIEVIDMDDVTFTQGIVERLIGVGTVAVTSSDRTHPTLLLKGIDEVRDVADKIDAARRRERVRRGLHIEAV